MQPGQDRNLAAEQGFEESVAGKASRERDQHGEQRVDEGTAEEMAQER